MTLHLLSLPLNEDWLDVYGHLAGGHYALAFEKAGWAFVEHLDMGEAYFRQTGNGLYLVESHTRFLKEVRRGSTLEFEGLVLGTDPKRHWLGLIMTVDGIERATWEYIEIHIDDKTGRSAPKPPDAQARMTRMCVSEPPAWAGRRLTLARDPAGSAAP